MEPADLNLDACFKVIELQKEKSETRKVIRSAKKKNETDFLIGYMGSGKTTLGRAFARATGLEFIDLDWYIEERLHKSISILLQNVVKMVSVSRKGRCCMRLESSKMWS